MGAGDMGNDLEAEIDDLRNEVESLKAKVFINEGAFDGINTSISDISSDLSKLDEEFHLSEKDWHPFMGHVHHSGTTIEVGSGLVYAGKAVYSFPVSSIGVSSLANGVHLLYMYVGVMPYDGAFDGSPGYHPELRTVINSSPGDINKFNDETEAERSCGIILGDFKMIDGVCVGWRQRWSSDIYVPVYTFMNSSTFSLNSNITVWGKMNGGTAKPTPDADAHYAALNDALKIVGQHYYVATWHLAINESTLWSDSNPVVR